MWYIKSTLNIYINVRTEFPAFPLQLSEKYTQIFQNRAHSARMIFVVCVCVSLFHITGFVWSFPELPNVAIFFFLEDHSTSVGYCMTIFLNSAPDQ